MDRKRTAPEDLHSGAETPVPKPIANYQPPRIVLFGKAAKIVQGQPRALNRDMGPDWYD